MLAITYKPMKINKNKGSQMGHTKKNIKKILKKKNTDVTQSPYLLNLMKHLKHFNKKNNIDLK